MTIEPFPSEPAESAAWPSSVVFPAPPEPGSPGAYLSVPAVYRIVRYAELLASHEVVGGHAISVDDYPRRVQHREYAGARGAEAVDAVIQAGLRLDPGQLLDLTATTAVGPPVVAEVRGNPNGPVRYVVVVGNQRCMSIDVALQRSPSRYDAYLVALAERARHFGLDAGAVAGVAARRSEIADLRAREVDQPRAYRASAPVLVRVLRSRNVLSLAGARGDVHRALGRLNRASDSSGFTKTRDPVSLAHSLAAEVRYLERGGAVAAGGDPDTPLGYLVGTVGSAATPAAYFRSPQGSEFFDKLLAAGVIGPYEQVAYAVTDRRDTKKLVLHAVGRASLEQLVHALAFHDPTVLDEAPVRLMARLARVLPALLRLGAGHPAWDLSRPLGLALRRLGVVHRAAATGGPGPHSISDALAQEALVSDELDVAFRADHRAVALARFLGHASTKRAAVAKAFEVWSAAAVRAGADRWWASQGDLFGGGGGDDPAFGRTLERAAEDAFPSAFADPAARRARVGAVHVPRSEFSGLLANRRKDFATEFDLLMMSAKLPPAGTLRLEAERRRPGPKHMHADRDVFAALCLSVVHAPPVYRAAGTGERLTARQRAADRIVERVDGAELFGISAVQRTCRRRVEMWRRDEPVRVVLMGYPRLPAWVRRKLAYPPGSQPPDAGVEGAVRTAARRAAKFAAAEVARAVAKEVTREATRAVRRGGVAPAPAAVAVVGTAAEVESAPPTPAVVVRRAVAEVAEKAVSHAVAVGIAQATARATGRKTDARFGRAQAVRGRRAVAPPVAWDSAS